MTGGQIIPRDVERKIELAFKALNSQIAALKDATGKDTIRANQIFTLQNQLTALQAEVRRLSAQIKDVKPPPAPGFARHFLLGG